MNYLKPRDKEYSHQGAKANFQASFYRSLPVSPKPTAQDDIEEEPVKMNISRKRAGLFQVIWRFSQVTWHVFTFFIVWAVDQVFIRDKNKRQKRTAIRMRAKMERLKGAMVKLGQQLSLRMDMLPYTVCQELSRLLDRIPPIPFQKTVAIIEENTGRSMQDLFECFDPNPVGSASIATVYQGILKNGDRVAVKVRRPNIEVVFSADLFIINFMMRAAEFLTILRQGLSRNLRKEFREILIRELDFRIEIRHQEVFNQYFKAQPNLQVTAPRLYYDLCGREVIVSEFVEGIWIQEIINAVEQNDEAKLAYLKSRNISPEKVAKRLIRANFHGLFESPVFHGDPHPGNILIQPNNQIVMVDFGACGVFSERERTLLQQMYFHFTKDDVGGMVQAIIRLMEPLPPINVSEFTKDLEDIWWQGYYGIKSNHAEWWERTSFRLWLGLLQLMRKYQIPMPLNILKMVRATLLYDTITARMYPKINIFKEYQLYYKVKAKEIKEDLEVETLEQLLFGFFDEQYVRLKRFLEASDLILFEVKRFLERPRHNFVPLANKLFYFMAKVFEMIIMIIFISTLLLLILVVIHPDHFNLMEKIFVDEGLRFFRSDNSNFWVKSFFAFWMFMVTLILYSYTRNIIWRLKDKEIK